MKKKHFVAFLTYPKFPIINGEKLLNISKTKYLIFHGIINGYWIIFLVFYVLFMQFFKNQTNSIVLIICVVLIFVMRPYVGYLTLKLFNGDIDGIIKIKHPHT